MYVVLRRDYVGRCWIGKKRLDRAMEQVKEEFTFHIMWKPYLLNPDVSDRGIILKDYIWQKYGKGYAEELISEINRNGAEVVSAQSYELPGPFR